MSAGLEQQVHHLPPERVLGEAQAGRGDGGIDLFVPVRRVGVGLGAGLPVGAERIGARQGRADQLAHAVGHAGGGPSVRTRRRHHQPEQVHQEGALGRQGGAAAELGVAGVDGMLRRHAEREPAGLVAALRRERLAHQRDQAGRGRADVDHRVQRQARLPACQGEGQAEGVHQHRLALAGQAVDQLEAVVAAAARRQRQGLAVGGAEEVRRTLLRCRPQRRRPAHREEAQRLAQRRQRGFRRCPAAEARHRGGQALQGIAGERGEHRLAPALGHLLQAAEPRRERRLAVGRRDPGEQPEAQPDDGMGVGAEAREVAQRVPGEQAVGGREGEEGRRDPGHGGIEAVQPAALDEEREAAGQAGRRQPRHQLGEGARMPGPEAHVEGAVEAIAEADAAPEPFRLADEELGRQRRRVRAGLGRLGQARRRVVRDSDGTPVPGGRGRAVHHAPHETERVVLAEPRAGDPALGEHRIERVQQRLVARPEIVQRELGALRVAGAGQPVA